VSPDLQTLIDLQDLDSKIARLEGEAARLPKRIDEIQAALAEARKAVDTVKARAEDARKSIRAKEKSLDDIAVKRSRAEAHLWEVKKNEEYTKAVQEIEAIKAQKAQVEEEILALMDLQERMVVEVREAEARLAAREEQARQDEAVVRRKLAAVEQELAGVRGDRGSRARGLAPALLSSYERILRARGGVAVASVGTAAICGACRVTIRPQAIQELRAANDLMICESCGRYLYWQEPA
jgi:predicted  nucleic acid-binding Zn-ribbon protein